jgi:CubicO group peptidase (beta-lactamase class C family)
MTTKHLFSLIFVGSLFTACTHSFNKPKIDSLLDIVAARHQGMGAIAIAQNGRLVYQKYIGIGNTLPAGPDTRYHIGSITKMFTAVMVFQLIGENKVQLTTPLSTFFPQIPNATKINIKMMLGHRSGLHNLTVDTAYGSYYVQPQTHAEMLARMAADKPDFEPDTETAYSNTNFQLLGYIIEKLTGKPYSEALKERITRKIGLTNTFYGEQHSNSVNDAKPFTWRKGHWQPTQETDMSVSAGAGAIVSTTSDMLKFIQALFNGKLVSAEQLELIKPVQGDIGLGMFKFDICGHISYGHTGGIDGFFTEVCYFPKEKIAVAFCSNGGADQMEDVLNGAMRIYFNMPYTIPTYKVTRIDSSKLTQYVGTYTSRDLPLKITISADDGVLSMGIPGLQAFPLQPVSVNTFESKRYGATLAFGTAQHTFVMTEGDQSFSYSLER